MRKAFPGGRPQGPPSPFGWGRGYGERRHLALATHDPGPFRDVSMSRRSAAAHSSVRVKITEQPQFSSLVEGAAQNLKPLAYIESATIIVTIVAINTQFAIAVHLMAGLAAGCDKNITSGKLAMSVNTSPSFVRRILAKLSKAGLVKTATGRAGACWLAKDPKTISLLEIYEAVDAPKAFSIHGYTEQKSCVVSCHIKAALEKTLAKTQKALEASLAEISLARIVADVKNK
ncbi:MAG: Rrf2 family transcriptional regulator [Pedosphaera sp.]|nr:Rrf2 family transcriptional regulator [Pedosphaera sp.]